MNNGCVRTAISIGCTHNNAYLCQPAKGEFDVFTIVKDSDVGKYRNWEED